MLVYSKAQYFKATGYFPITLDKGRYSFNLKYKLNKSIDINDKCLEYKPDTDWQNISIDIINLN